MTLQTFEDLHENGKRLHPDVASQMRVRHNGDPPTPWHVEYEVPAETNGWVYYGNAGAASVTHVWYDDPHPNEATQAVVLHHTPTHPQDETADLLRVYHTDDLEDETDRGETVSEIEGEPYRTPLYVKRRLFWEGVEAAITWMETNPPE